MKPKEFNRALRHRKKPVVHRSQFTRWVALLVAIILVIVSSGYGLYQRKIPPFTVQTVLPTYTTHSAPPLWPSTGTAAIGVQGNGILTQTENQLDSPTASVAKVITALAILRKHPLKSGEQGPMITITQRDVDLYTSYTAQNGSSTLVKLGEQISEFQALQAMMLPSANNIADTTAIWAYGSMENYHTAANTLVKALAMNHTTIAGDASGFSALNRSTSHDLVLLGQAVMNEPVLREIVAMPEATLPTVGVIRNVNWLLGSDGFVGIKTGNTDEAGGCFLFATQRSVEGKKVTLIGAIMAQPTLHEALLASQRLTKSIYEGITSTKVAYKDQSFAHYKTPWGATSDAVVTKNISLLSWKQNTPALTVVPNSSDTPLSNTSQVGVLTIDTGIEHTTTKLVLKHQIAQPPLFWRIFRLH